MDEKESSSIFLLRGNETLLASEFSLPYHQSTLGQEAYSFLRVRAHAGAGLRSGKGIEGRDSENSRYGGRISQDKKDARWNPGARKKAQPFTGNP